MIRKVGFTLGIVFLGVMIPFAAGAAESPRVGYVDVVKVLDSTAEGKRAKATMEEILKSRQKIIDLDEAELKKLQDEISKQAAVLSPDALKEKEAQFQQKFVGYQRRVETMKTEVDGKKKEVLEQFNKDMEAIVRKVAQKEKFDLVLDKNHELGILVYASESLDLTDKVVKEFEKTYP
ncbi:MAG TPA: OmpH family outer membrane protein [Nitrospiria bacterium]|nr:OmpH family outer membrane protein [Nitrospiria bacterium]